MEKLFTEAELSANGYGSRGKLRQDRVRGCGIPFIYVGTAVRYRESDIKQWLEENRVTHALQRPRGAANSGGKSQAKGE